MLSTYAGFVLIGGILIYYGGVARCNHNSTKNTYRGGFPMYSFVFHILFWTPILIAVFADFIYILLLPLAVLLTKIMLSFKSMTEMMVLDKKSVVSRRHIEDLMH